MAKCRMNQKSDLLYKDENILSQHDFEDKNHFDKRLQTAK